MLLMREGKTAEAEAEYRSALAVYRKLADQSPDVDEFRGGQASTRNALGILLSNRGKPTEAEAPSAGASGGRGSVISEEQVEPAPDNRDQGRRGRVADVPRRCGQVPPIGARRGELWSAAT
jgi:hypothetical protein